MSPPTHTDLRNTNHAFTITINTVWCVSVGVPTDTLTDLLASLHSHLEATGECPVAQRESRWLGEAEAIAADLRYGSDLEPATIRERASKIERLLAEVEETGSEDADDHVAAARRCLNRIDGAIEEAA
jgi:hypothetical protein